MSDTRDNDRYLFLFALRTFRRLLASYALPLLLPIVVSSAVYTAAISSIEKEVGRANESVVLLMKRIVDARLNQLSAAADQLSLNEEVISTTAAVPELSANQRLTMSSVQSLLRQVALANEFIDGIYLYFPGSGYVLSNVSRFAEGEFGYVSREKFDMSAEEWQRTFLSSPYRSFRLLPSENPGEAPSFAFSQKIVSQYSGSTSGVIVIKSDGKRFLDLLDSFKWNPDASLAVLSPDGSIAARPGLPTLSAELKHDTLPKEYRSCRAASRTGIQYVSTIGSDVSDWRYAYLVPARTYSRSADFVKTVMAAYVLVCLLGGLLLSFFLARREYTPIRRLSRIFLDRLGSAENGADGDFPYLEGALRGLLREHENLEELIRRQNGTVRNGLLARLLQGGATQFDALLESCRTCGVVFPSDRCLAVAVTVFDGAHSIGGEAESSEVDTGSLVRYMLQPLLDELLAERASAYVIETAAGIRCIVCLSQAENPDRFIGEMKTVTEKIRSLFAERFGLSLSFAVSKVYESLSLMPLAGVEVDEMIESITLYDRRDVTVCCGELGPDAEQATAVRSSLALHRSIAESLTAGDFPAAQESVFRFLDTEILGPQLPLQTAKLRISGIVNIVIEALQEMKPALDAASIDELNPMGRLSRVRSVAELKNQVEEIFLVLEARLGAKISDQHAVLKDEVVAYVQENFRDRNLNVNSIADFLGVSVPHLSRSFKKATDIGLLDYLHIVRVREAKRLMKANKFGIGEIAVMVGFGSRVTLARAFKRYEGVAPSAFREKESD